MAPSHSASELQDLAIILDEVCAALQATYSHLSPDIQFGQQLILNDWKGEVTQAYKTTRRKWTNDQAREVLTKLQGLVPMIERRWIKEIGAMIQAWQIRQFPSIPLEPLISRLPTLPSQDFEYYQPRAPAPHSHHASPGASTRPIPSTPPVHHVSPSLTVHQPAPQRSAVLRQALDLFSKEYPLEQQNAPAHRHDENTNFLANLEENDTSYRSEIFSLFSPIKVAWDHYVRSYCHPSAWNSFFDLRVDWEEGVREYVPQVWVYWGVAHDGVGRRQAREMVEQVLKHIQDGTFKVFPPVELFKLLPRSSRTLFDFDPEFQQALDHHSLHPSPPAQNPFSPRTVGADAYTHYYGEYEHALEQLLHDHPHLRAYGQHQHQQPHSLHYPPPHPNEHNMQELARWHRRMTDRQAKRYGTTTRAFAAGL